jgi:hypothetical protein
MNSLILFDYIFYRIARFYDVKFKYSQSKKQAGIGILSLIQFSNILALSNFLKNDLIGFLPCYVFISVYIVLFGLNYIRYMRLLKFEKLELKWSTESNNTRLLKGILIIVYFILSVYLINP